MSIPNVKLLRDVLAKIKEHPETHDQRVWARQTECGTCFCFAGHTVNSSNQDGRYKYKLGPFRDIDLYKSKSQVFWDVEAQKLLGISHTQAYILFYLNNTIEDLERIVNKICAPYEITETTNNNNNAVEKKSELILVEV